MTIIPPIPLISSIPLLLLFACAGDPEPPPNPFEGNRPSGDTLIIPNQNLDPQSIEGLHASIFAPTCANSGCHDGSFEPDFRSIEGAYNTLVYHPVVKNNPAGDFDYRVVPGNPSASVIWERLNRDIDGQSGIMPLEVDPDSDWDEKQETYRANIEAWISAGAKDIFGNSPQLGNIAPSCRGMIAYADGAGNPLDREAGSGPIQVLGGTGTLDIWFSFMDDQVAADQLQYNQVRRNEEADGFDTLNEESLQLATARTEIGLFGTAEIYQHHISIPLAGYSVGTQVFVRVYVKESSTSPIVEIPTDASALYMKQYFSFMLL